MIKLQHTTYLYDLIVPYSHRTLFSLNADLLAALESAGLERAESSESVSYQTPSLHLRFDLRPYFLIEVLTL